METAILNAQCSILNTPVLLVVTQKIREPIVPFYSPSKVDPVFCFCFSGFWFICVLQPIQS